MRRANRKPASHIETIRKKGPLVTATKERS